MGVSEGVPPAPLGDVQFRQRGGDPRLLVRLEAASDVFDQQAQVEQGPWTVSVGLVADRPIYTISRSIPAGTPTVPVLFVLGKGRLHLPGASD